MAIVKGHGTILKCGSTTITQRVTISGPNRAVDSIETTNLDTATAKTFRPGLVDNGEISCEFQYDPNDASHTSLESKVGDDAEAWSVIYNTDPAVTISFSAFVTGFEVSGMESGSNLTGSLTLKISGNITKDTEE